MVSIGIDIGGSKIAFGLVNDGVIVKYLKVENIYRGDTGAMLLCIKENVKQLCTETSEKVTKVGVGCPGWVVDGVVYEAVNLGIDRLDLQADLRAACNLPVYVENDARTALLAEMRYGTLRGCVNGMMVTYGTGVGGALVLGGKIYRGSHGMAGEIGHITFWGSQLCLCGKTGCFEKFASVSALVSQAQRAGTAVGNGAQIFAAARGGDMLALEILDEFISLASVGPRELAMLLDLDTVVVGGGISCETALFVSPLAEKINQFAPRCSVVPATFGNEAGVIGASELPE